MFLRSSHRSAGLWLVAFLVLAVLQNGTVWASPILDQSYDPSGNITVNAGFSGMNSNQERAQTFEVGVTGQLTSISVFVEVFSPVTGNLDLDTPLASASLPASAVPLASNGGGFVNFDLSSFNIQVTAGEELAIDLHASPGASVFGWLGANNDPYPNGESYERVIGNHDWVGSSGTDLGFQDFVNPGVAAVPEPSTFVLLASGCVGLLGYGWRRRK
jgi:hypothetical protein